MTNYSDIVGGGNTEPGNLPPGYLGGSSAPSNQPLYSLWITAPQDWASRNKIDYGRYMLQTGWSITENFGRQADTATFYLVDQHQPNQLSFSFQTASTIELVDNRTGAVLFGGLIAKPIFSWQGPTLVKWELDCVGYDYYLSKAIITQGTGSYGTTTLGPPTAPTVTPVGTEGTTTYTYYIVATDSQNHKSAPSPAGTTSLGNATLNGTNYNTITWTPPIGAVSIDILKGDTSHSLVTGIPVATTSYNDTGGAVTPYVSGYGNLTVDAIVLEILSANNVPVQPPYDSWYGILASPSSQGGYVYPGPTIDLVNLDNLTIKAALDELAQLASGATGEPWGWYVDELRQLHFVDQSNADIANVRFTTDVTAQGSLSVGHITYDSTFKYTWDGSDIRNTIELSGISLNTQHVDTWTGDGNTRQWILSFGPDTSNKATVPTLTVNAVAQTVAFYNGTPDHTNDFLLFQGTDQTWSLQVNQGVVPTSGQAIVLTYTYTANYLTTSEAPYIYSGLNPYDGPNRGRYVEFVSNPGMSTLSTTQAYGDREWGEYGWAQETVVFSSTEDFIGHVRAGQIITFIHYLLPDSQRNYDPGVAAQFLITQLQISPSSQGAGYRQYQITAIRIISSQVQGGLRAYTFQDLIDQLNKQSSSTGTKGTAGAVPVVVTVEEAFVVSAGYTITATSAPTWDNGDWGLVLAQ